MKIGLLTSHRWKKEYESLYQKMVDFFESHGHEVVASDISLEEIIPLSYVERESIFRKHYQALEDCDIIFAECTLQSTQVGYGLAYLRSKGRPTVILSLKHVNEMQTKGEVYSEVENLAVFEYTKEDLKTVLADALAVMEVHLDKRFTIIFPAHLMARVEEEARKRHLPKAVYIRQLIEKDFAKNSSE